MLYNDFETTSLVRATLDGPDRRRVELDDAAIRGLELHRARRSLAYLKARIGDAAMRRLLQADLDRTGKRAQRWAGEANGRWQSGVTTLTTPGPSAGYFRDWFMGNLERRNVAVFLAAHPDHFVDCPLPDGRAEVIENFGEDELPWQIFLEFTDTSVEFPTPWDPGYPPELAFGAVIRTGQDCTVGYVTHELRDVIDGDRRVALECKLTVHLPATAPVELVEGHLRHFAIEFRNWTELARGGVSAVHRCGEAGS